MKKGNLLLIDDEELLTRNLKILLQSYAETIFIANNGKEGLEIFQKESIQLIVCDVAMPEMNGVELIKAIRGLGSDVPFIFYTAYGHSELMLKAAEYGAFDYLRKPDFEGLEEVIVRGLREGFEREQGKPDSSVLLTEYEKILQSLKKI